MLSDRMSKILFPVSGLLLMLLCGCETLPTKFSQSQQPRPVEPLPFEKKGYKIVYPSPSVTPMATIARRTVAVKPGKTLSPSEVTELLEQAEDKAVSAANLAESAQSKEDWALVIAQWKKAIDTLKPIGSSAGAQKSAVQQKLSDYQRNLANAQQQAKTNPRQIQADEKPSENGIPLIITSGEDNQPSPSPSTSPTASPTASSSPSASPSPQ